MTLAEGKRKVLMILDEYSSGGEITQDIDINNKMNDFFDMAQKDMATYQRIVKTVTVQMDADSDYTMLPADFMDYFRTWKDGKPYRKYPVVNGKMYTAKEQGTFILEYFANPQTINQNTPDTYVFEVNAAAANCLPFYVAAQQLIVDLVVDYSAIWNMYLTQKATLPMILPAEGNGGVRNVLFGGR